MISVTQLAMIYGQKLLFTEVSLNLVKKKRYGLIGANGSGKSTFIKLLSGTEIPDDGQILTPKNTTIAWLDQNQFKHDEMNTIDFVIMGKDKLFDALTQKDALLEKEDLSEQDGMKLAHLEQIIYDQDGYSADSDASTLLIGLGIAPDMLKKPLKLLSGGYKMRALLAQCLFKRPEVLLLDEPTNHLDIMTTAWLERYLVNDFNGLLVFISHDISFINSLATHILDIDYGEIRQYTGNYNQFIKQKEELQEQKAQAIKNTQKKIETMQRFVDRFRAKASKAKQAQSKMKMIDKIEMPDMDHSIRHTPNIEFKMNKPSSKVVLSVKDLSFAFDDKKLYQNVTFKLTRGEKLCIIGHNGIGKSTFIKNLLGMLPKQSGDITWGGQTEITYFSQDHHEALQGRDTMLSWLTQAVKNVSESEIRKTLAGLLFKKADVFKTIDILSGGEAARVLFAKIMLEKPNVLVLDEPTNHLDLESTQALISAIKKYAGTTIMVSHNRDFISKTAKRLWVLTEKGHTDFQGSYKDFISDFGADFLEKSFNPKDS